MADGESVRPIKLREKDFWVDVADDLNRVIEIVQDPEPERTAWLIKHHMQAHLILDGSIGARARRRLQTSESSGYCCCKNKTNSFRLARSIALPVIELLNT